MADAPQLTTDQYDFCRAVDAMRLDLLRRRKNPAWLVAHPVLLAQIWGQGDGGRPTEVRVCGLKVAELSTCPPGSFYLSHRKPDGAQTCTRRHDR